MKRVIKVRGTATTSSVADLVQITIDLNSENLVHSDAMSELDDKIKQLVDALSTTGFTGNDLKTSNYSTKVKYNYEKYDDYGNSNKIFDGYICTQSLNLSFDFSKEKLNEVLSALSTYTSKLNFYIQFSAKDKSTIKRDLLNAISSDARNRAEILCSASGVKLGELIEINYNDENYCFNSDTELYSDGAVLSRININPSDITISDYAYFTWEII